MTLIDRKQHVKADGRQQNKDKPKKGHLPQDMIDEGRYLAAHTVSDVWICYPWEATYVVNPVLLLICTLKLTLFLSSDIDEHDALAESQVTN